MIQLIKNINKFDIDELNGLKTELDNTQNFLENELNEVKIMLLVVKSKTDKYYKNIQYGNYGKYTQIDKFHED